MFRDRKHTLLCGALISIAFLIFLELLSIFFGDGADGPDIHCNSLHGCLQIVQFDAQPVKTPREEPMQTLILKRVDYKSLVHFNNRIPNIKLDEKILANISDGIDCEILHIHGKKPYPLCIYSLDQDDAISVLTRTGTIYDDQHVRKVLDLLEADPDLGFIDLGAHIGTYASMALHTGHKVFAVEPVIGHMKRLAKSATMVPSKGCMVALINALSNRRGNSHMMIDSRDRKMAAIKDDCKAVSAASVECQPTVLIHMDDLFGILPFRSAIMKVSLMGHEPEAFQESSKFFKFYNVQVIVMDWRWFIANQPFDEAELNKITGLLKMLTDWHYVPKDVFDKGLRLENWHQWPDHIYWHHS